MKKIGLKLLTVAFALCVIVGAFAGCAKRDEVLKVYNWGEYMDPAVIGMFEEWYTEKTGKPITVKYGEFGGNEAMLTKIENKRDWDVVCPSDYMIQRMREKNLLQPLSQTVVDKMNEVGNEFILDMIKSFDDPAQQDGNTYSVPYIWGTFGIMYDTEKLTAAQIASLDSWAALWNPEFSGNIYMKDQVRDSYTVAMLYARRAELEAASNGFTAEGYASKEYRDLIDDLFQKFDANKTAEAKAALLAQKPYLLKYESDDGKTDMVDGTGGSLGMFWSCDAGFAMNDFETEPSFFSCSGEPIVVKGNKKLGYVMPKEGSNVWVDGWVIPKTAKNPTAANLFIEFMLDEEIATLNSEYAGAPSANDAAMTALRELYEEDEDGYFEGTYEGYKEMYLEMRFPTETTLSRCAVMKDFGAEFDNVRRMWQDVKNAR